MSRTDLKHDLSVVQVIAPANHTATDTSDGVDLAGFDAAVVVVDVGAVSADDFEIEVQHSDDDGDTDPYAPVPDAELDGTEPATLTATTVTALGYHGIKRYIRVVASDGGTGDADFGVSVIRGKGRVRPTS